MSRVVVSSTFAPLHLISHNSRDCDNITCMYNAHQVYKDEPEQIREYAERMQMRVANLEEKLNAANLEIKELKAVTVEQASTIKKLNLKIEKISHERDKLLCDKFNSSSEKSEVDPKNWTVS